MSDDYKVNPRSDKDVREIARRTKLFLGVENSVRPVNITRILEKTSSIRTQFGAKQLVYKPVDDNSLELVGDDARTVFDRRMVTIFVKASVHERARLGVGRDRMTLAHELGHAVMHPGAPKSRAAGATGTTSLSKTNAFESAEHQAKVFASAFLIHDDVALKLTAREIAIEFLVSSAAAEIAREWLDKVAERRASNERVRAINDALQSGKPINAMPDQTGMLCVTCGNPTRIQLGTKSWCPNCPSVRDQFPDGDD